MSPQPWRELPPFLAAPSTYLHQPTSPPVPTSTSDICTIPLELRPSLQMGSNKGLTESVRHPTPTNTTLPGFSAACLPCHDNDPGSSSPLDSFRRPFLSPARCDRHGTPNIVRISTFVSHSNSMRRIKEQILVRATLPRPPTWSTLSFPAGERSWPLLKHWSSVIT
jgi:hypothetical protein